MTDAWFNGPTNEKHARSEVCFKCSSGRKVYVTTISASMYNKNKTSDPKRKVKYVASKIAHQINAHAYHTPDEVRGWINYMKKKWIAKKRMKRGPMRFDGCVARATANKKTQIA